MLSRSAPPGLVEPGRGQHRVRRESHWPTSNWCPRSSPPRSETTPGPRTSSPRKTPSCATASLVRSGRIRSGKSPSAQGRAALDEPRHRRRLATPQLASRQSNLGTGLDRTPTRPGRPHAPVEAQSFREAVRSSHLPVAREMRSRASGGRCLEPQPRLQTRWAYGRSELRVRTRFASSRRCWAWSVSTLA